MHVVEAGEAVHVVAGRGDIFELYFDIERPEPDRELALELEAALKLPKGERFPKVSFETADYSWSF